MPEVFFSSQNTLKDADHTGHKWKQDIIFIAVSLNLFLSQGSQALGQCTCAANSRLRSPGV